LGRGFRFQRFPPPPILGWRSSWPFFCGRHRHNTSQCGELLPFTLTSADFSTLLSSQSWSCIISNMTPRPQVPSRAQIKNLSHRDDYRWRFWASTFFLPVPPNTRHVSCQHHRHAFGSPSSAPPFFSTARTPRTFFKYFCLLGGFGEPSQRTPFFCTRSFGSKLILWRNSRLSFCQAGPPYAFLPVLRCSSPVMPGDSCAKNLCGRSLPVFLFVKLRTLDRLFPPKVKFRLCRRFHTKVRNTMYVDCGAEPLLFLMRLCSS